MTAARGQDRAPCRGADQPRQPLPPRRNQQDALTPHGHPRRPLSPRKTLATPPQRTFPNPSSWPSFSKPTTPSNRLHPHRQTNARFIHEYPNLREYVKDLYSTHGGALGRRCACWVRWAGPGWGRQASRLGDARRTPRRADVWRAAGRCSLRPAMLCGGGCTRDRGRPRPTRGPSQGACIRLRCVAAPLKLR